MNKKAVFLQIFVATVAIISIIIYINLAGTKAATFPDTPPESQCIQNISNQLLDQRREQSPPLAVYFVPAEALEKSDSLLASEMLAEHNIQPITSLESLKRRVAQAPKPVVIYLHPEVVDQVDDDWLRQQYEAGIGIVALNTLVSQLGQKLNADPRMEDLRLEYQRGRTYLALFHKVSVGTATSDGVFADFVESPDFIVDEIVPSMVDTYSLTDEYRQQVAEECLK